MFLSNSGGEKLRLKTRVNNESRHLSQRVDAGYQVRMETKWPDLQLTSLLLPALPSTTPNTSPGYSMVTLKTYIFSATFLLKI